MQLTDERSLCETQYTRMALKWNLWLFLVWIYINDKLLYVTKTLIGLISIKYWHKD